MDKESEESIWLKWAKELQFIGQAGLTYSQDSFDRERFDRIREISAEIMSYQTELPFVKIKDLFCNEEGFQTPKLDTRAAIFKDEKILLVQEKDGRWSLPGGWVDVNQTIKTNTEKEVLEESGLHVIASKIIAVQDRNKHNYPPFPYNVCKVFVMCKLLGGTFRPNTETLQIEYFSINDLPDLSEERNSFEQIKMCFKAHNTDTWEVLFD